MTKRDHLRVELGIKSGRWYSTGCHAAALLYDPCQVLPRVKGSDQFRIKYQRLDTAVPTVDNPQMASVARLVDARYAIAVVAFSLAVVVRWALVPVLGSGWPYISLYPAIMLSAWYGGLWPGLLVTALGAAEVMLWPIAPLPSSSSIVPLTLYLFNGVAISAVTGLLHRARRRENELNKAAQRLLREQEARTAADAKAAESLRLFRSSIDQAGDTIFFVHPDGRLFDVNETACRQLGYTREQLTAMRIWDVDPDHPQQSWRAHWEELKARGRLRFETRHRRREGTTFPVEVAVQYVRDGEREFACGLARDISERKRADRERETLIRDLTEARTRTEELHQAAARTDLLLAAIVENLPDMIFVKEAKDLRFLLLNRAAEELLGWDRSSLLGKTDHDFFPEVQANFFQQNDRAVLSSGTLRDIPEEIIQTRNDERILHTKKVPIRGSDGRPLYLLGISSDITERKNAERERELLVEQLEKALIARDDILAMVSHDLKNPVGAILMSAALLAKLDIRGQDANLFRESTDGIRRTALQMNSLIETLLDAAAIESGHFSVAPKSGLASMLVDEALQLMRPKASEKDLHLERGVVDPLPVRCDRDRIHQVFSNLIGNAIKFTPAGGTITVSAGRDGDAVRFAVIDSGAGISEEALPHLFERYWKANRTTRTGSGLGLYIVRGIVQAHGGKVWAENRQGAGSSFFFTLPVATG